MNNNTETGFQLFMLGLVMGSILGILVFIFVSRVETVEMSDLTGKHTINMKNCYAQYSAVRRFPK